MNTRFFALAAALLTTLVSAPAMAWSVPIHECNVSSTPSPAGQDIPCSFTNDDGQTFNGVVSTTSNGTVLCTGLIVPNPDDNTEADSYEELYLELGLDFGEAPYCAIEHAPKGGDVNACYDEAPEVSAAVQICGEGWCLELTSYDDCNDYYSTEADLEGVSCNDIV